MKLATAAGVPIATATHLTADDVKAADSDQMTISFDTEGNYKKRVAADWYDHFIRARDINDEITKKFWGREGIERIGLRGGGNNDNPHVIVALDESKSEKENRRGEIPEWKNDVRIDVIEESGEKKLNCDDENADVSQLPGGVASEVGFVGTTCTNGPRCMTGSDHQLATGWSLASHCMDQGDSVSGDCSTEADVVHNYTEYGDIVYWDHDRDFAYVEQTGLGSPVSETVYPADHSQSHHIHGTVSESGMGSVLGDPGKVWGITSCEVIGSYQELNVTWNVDHPCNPNNTLIDMLKLETGVDITESGDSGSLWMVQEPDTDDWFAAASHSGAKATAIDNPNYAFGPQGFSIRDVNNMWWDDL